MLVYRTFPCCRKMYAKVVHAVLFLGAIACICCGMFAAIDAHNDGPAPVHFYSMHSWIGLVACGLFALQVYLHLTSLQLYYIVGFTLTICWLLPYYMSASSLLLSARTGTFKNKELTSNTTRIIHIESRLVTLLVNKNLAVAISTLLASSLASCSVQPVRVGKPVRFRCRFN